MPWSRRLPLLMLLPLLAGRLPAQQPRVGPARGTVVVVGGGAMGPEIYRAFIAAAGGPDALIVDIPTAGGAASYDADNAAVRAWRKAGARHVVLLHTTDRRVADSDSLADVLARAGGVWFEGGRQFHLVDAYAGTKTEAAFHAVLDRGGVVGGSSAGATILGDFLVRGAPSNDNSIMDDPRYEHGFAFLRGVAIDQHVVARERLADLADSIMPKHPPLLGMAEDEGTAWVIRGDTAAIIGRDKAFAYGGAGHDTGTPFLTLHPGDRYDLGARRLLHRVSDDDPALAGLVDGLFVNIAGRSGQQATVLVARDGAVLADRSFGIPPQPKYMPTTTVPQFDVGEIASVFRALCNQLPEAPIGRRNDTPFQACLAGPLGTPIGLHKTTAATDGAVSSDVDELYRLAVGLEAAGTFRAADSTRAIDSSAGWGSDLYRGDQRFSAFGLAGGRRDAFIRMPAVHLTVIILTNDDNADTRRIANEIVQHLLDDGR